MLTKSSGQCAFFDQVAYVLEDFNVDPKCHIGGDFNTDFHSNLDNLGGSIESIGCVKKNSKE